MNLERSGLRPPRQTSLERTRSGAATRPTRLQRTTTIGLFPLFSTIFCITLLLLCSLSASLGHPENPQQPNPQQQQQQQGHQHRHVPFAFGDELKIECVTPDENGTVFVDQFGDLIYGPGPICAETGETWTFHYGVETNIVCRWHIDASLFNFLKMIINGQAVYRCRLKMSKEGSIYMPFPVAIWGGVEPQHIHAMNHFSFTFHASEGFLVGGAAYPLRDHFQLLEPGSMLTIHGPVKWFEGHSYEPLKAPADAVASVASQQAAAAVTAKAAEEAKKEGGEQQQQQQQQQGKEQKKEQPTPEARPPSPPPPPAIAPQIPMQPVPNKHELSERACKHGYGFYEPFIVALYCLLTSVATCGICFLVYLSYVKSEGMQAGRKAK